MSIAARDNPAPFVSPHAIIDDILGYRRAKVLMAAAYLDLFSLLERPATACALADSLSLDSRAAEMLLDALAAMKYVDKRGGSYVNAALSSRFLVKGRGDYIGDNLKYQEIIWDAWSQLRPALKKGGAPRPLSYWLTRHKGFVGEYIRGMDNIAKKPAEEIARALVLGTDRPRRMLDVGCGPGTYSAAFLKENAGLHAELLDLPVTLRLTRRLMARHPEAARRFRLVPGDYRKKSFGENRYDLILMSHITHDESPEMNRRMFRRAHRALRPGGRLVVHDFTVSDDRVFPEFGALFSIHMLVYTEGGRTYTRREYREWMTEAGFRGLWDRPVAAAARNASRIIVGSKEEAS